MHSKGEKDRGVLTDKETKDSRVTVAKLRLEFLKGINRKGQSRSS